jgi:hypothetical protein
VKDAGQAFTTGSVNRDTVQNVEELRKITPEWKTFRPSMRCKRQQIRSVSRCTVNDKRIINACTKNFVGFEFSMTARSAILKGSLEALEC